MYPGDWPTLSRHLVDSHPLLADVCECYTRVTGLDSKLTSPARVKSGARVISLAFKELWVIRLDSRALKVHQEWLVWTLKSVAGVQLVTVATHSASHRQRRPDIMSTIYHPDMQTYVNKRHPSNACNMDQISIFVCNNHQHKFALRRAVRLVCQLSEVLAHAAALQRCS